MAQKVVRLGIKRDTDYLYYISGSSLCRKRRKQPGVPIGREEKVAALDVELDRQNFIYFLDKDGDVARAKRAVGGQKRKKKAKKKAKKKVAKKKNEKESNQEKSD